MIPRLYVWSILLEPLLFFIIADQSFLIIPTSLARIIQILVVSGLIFLFLYKLTDRKFNILIINIKNPLYFYIFLHFFFLIIIGIFSIFVGTYDIYFQTNVVIIPNSVIFRPLFEYFIELFYIVYFFILPFYIFKSRVIVDYFFYYFRIVFLLCLVFGFIDILSIYFLDFPLIPRHITDWKFVGFRFHGIAGEPRQAYIYLVFGLAILNLKAFYYDKKMSVWWLIFVSIAIGFTQSMTAIVGLLFFILLYLSRSFLIGAGNFFRGIATPFVALIFIILILFTSDRLIDYLEDISTVLNVLDSGEKLPYLMEVQSTSIFPIYDLLVKVRNFDLLPVFFGSGLGSSSIINNIYIGGEYELKNPNSQIIKILYEGGLVGLFLIIKAFLYPIKRLTNGINLKNKKTFIIYTLLLLGAFFAIRSPTIYIYLGICIVVFKLKLKLKFKQPPVSGYLSAQ